MNPNSKKLSFLGSSGWKQKIEVLPGSIHSEGSEGICVSCLCRPLVEASSPWFMLSISVLSHRACSSLRLSFSSWELKCPQCLSANIWMLSCQAIGNWWNPWGVGLSGNNLHSYGCGRRDHWEPQTLPICLFPYYHEMNRPSLPCTFPVTHHAHAAISPKQLWIKLYTSSLRLI